MSNIINFFTHNAEKLIFIAAGTIILTSLTGVFYFFIYSYIVNKRLKQPEKKHRIKLIMPRFACIILAVISLFFSIHLSNHPLLLGPISYVSTSWCTEYNFVNEDRSARFTKKELDKSNDFTLYESSTDYFKYSMYFNKSFNGIINLESKNCEFVCFVDYIGKDKNLNKMDIIKAEFLTLPQGSSLGSGIGVPNKISETPLCFYGATDKMDVIDITMSIFKEDKYEDLDKLESEIEENGNMDEVDEKDFMYLEEHLKFDTTDPILFKYYTKLIDSE